jgi:hypothetical protein
MLIDLISFLIVLIVTILSFSTIFNILFRTESIRYKNLWTTYISMFSSGLGNFEFNSD